MNHHYTNKRVYARCESLSENSNNSINQANTNQIPEDDIQTSFPIRDENSNEEREVFDSMILSSRRESSSSEETEDTSDVFLQKLEQENGESFSVQGPNYLTTESTSSFRLQQESKK